PSLHARRRRPQSPDPRAARSSRPRTHTLGDRMDHALDSIHSALRTALPFEWARLTFMLNALMIVAVLAPLCAALGVKVVNYRMAFFSDAPSPPAFTGVVLGYLLVPLFSRLYPSAADWSLVLPPITLVVFGIAVGLGITAVRHRTDLSTDTVI